ncbi:MAG: hypothetical protein KDD94_04415 [Calditrichaeota bacterium]|nr:hypothetical protein [Calditrichota bacterium]
MKKTNVAIIWNYSQPFLKDMHGNYLLPVVRQYLQRDYIDMLKIAEKYESAELTFNILPALLEQLLDYVNESAYDYSWFLSQKNASELTSHDKIYMLNHFFNGVDEIIIFPYPRYSELYERTIELIDRNELKYIEAVFNEQDFRDLQVWHNLAWIGNYSAKDSRIQKLLKKGRDYNEADKVVLFDYLKSLFSEMLEIYSTNFNSNKIDISTTAFYKSVLPLIIDNQSVRLKNENYTLPLKRFRGLEYAKRQLLFARKYFKYNFKISSLGFIPYQSMVDTKTLKLISKLRFKWTLLEEEHLVNQTETSRFYPKYFGTENSHKLMCILNDKTLSDRFSTVYPNMKVTDAVDDLFNQLEQYRDQINRGEKSGSDALITISVSGDKLWDRFHGNGLDFLNMMYQRFEDSDQFQLRTISSFLENYSGEERIETLNTKTETVYFDRWIGSPAANRAWDLLAQTDQFIARVLEEGEISEKLQSKVRKQFQICLGSDWFEWYSDVSTKWDIYYDELFRSNLIKCYELLHEKAPRSLFFNLKNESSDLFKSLPVTGLISPEIDGILSNDDEWKGSALYDANKQRIDIGTHSDSYFNLISIGYNEDNVYFRVIFQRFPQINFHLEIDFFSPEQATLIIKPLQDSVDLFDTSTRNKIRLKTQARFELDSILEFEIPVNEIGLVKNRIFAVQFSLFNQEDVLERFPQTSVIRTIFLDDAVYH